MIFWKLSFWTVFSALPRSTLLLLSKALQIYSWLHVKLCQIVPMLKFRWLTDLVRDQNVSFRKAVLSFRMQNIPFWEQNISFGKLIMSFVRRNIKNRNVYHGEIMPKLPNKPDTKLARLLQILGEQAFTRKCLKHLIAQYSRKTYLRHALEAMVDIEEAHFGAD